MVAVDRAVISIKVCKMQYELYIADTTLTVVWTEIRATCDPYEPNVQRASG
jgi:hypothetical protein